MERDFHFEYTALSPAASRLPETARLSSKSKCQQKLQGMEPTLRGEVAGGEEKFAAQKGPPSGRA